MTIHNPELQLATDFVVQTDCNLFLTGKAGTGKTTFLHAIKKKTHKRLIVTAPTGVAAINAGGVTIHSFFQMPFGPFVPGSEAYERTDQHKFSKEKRKIIKSLDMLVIDEISMVRADLLDGIDTILRRFRRSNRPFGGVQLLMIGDLHQLSPVAKESEWQILRQFYDSVYFFSSNALNKTDLVSIELQHIYRQSEGDFIALLNKVRDNKLDPAALEKLNSRFQPEFNPPENEGYITLSTHNRKADAINDTKLGALTEKKRSFEAVIEGEFPEHTYPTQAHLELKKGAQVMFVRNDNAPERRYFNGKIGKIVNFADEAIIIACPGDEDEIAVEPVTWENIKYSIDDDSKEIIEDKIGQFIQYPLKLAWAITIHKSQGLTFERAVIDAQAAFAHGQVYVALSRCRTFNGMVLSTPITPQAVKTDVVVSRFIENSHNNPASGEMLAAAKIRSQQRLLNDCFDFQGLQRQLDRLNGILQENAQVVQVADGQALQEMKKRTIDEICVVGENFQRQLARLYGECGLPESDSVLVERAIKGSAYFREKFDTVLLPGLRDLRTETDNKEIRKRLKNRLNDLKKECAIKLAAVKSCENGFTIDRYLRAVSAAEINFKPGRQRKAEVPLSMLSDLDHPELYNSLKEWRAGKAEEAGVQEHRVLHQNILLQVAALLPESIPALKKVRGVGKKTAEKYGKDLLRLVTDYCRKHEITEKNKRAPEPGSVRGT